MPSDIVFFTGFSNIKVFNAAVAEWLGRRTPRPCLKLRRAEGREFDPRPGQYSRMSFSSVIIIIMLYFRPIWPIGKHVYTIVH